MTKPNPNPVSKLHTDVLIGELSKRGYDIKQKRGGELASVDLFLEYLGEKHCGKIFRRLIETLLDCYPSSVSYNKLTDALYGDDPNGGALTSKKVIQVEVCHLRKLLRGRGYTIDNVWGHGYKLVKVYQSRIYWP